MFYIRVRSKMLRLLKQNQCGGGEYLCKNFNSSSCTPMQQQQQQQNEYKKCIAALNLLQSNKQDLASPRSRQFAEDKCEIIAEYLSKCGLEVPMLESKLSVIHVAGTKGKGSTCAYCESLLCEYGYRTGLFSSPHLVSVRERIRINGEPISEEKFVTYFGQVYNQLSSFDKGTADADARTEKMPTYFMFLTIMAFKVFVEERIDVAIIEVGIGGQYDYTNVLSKTAVVGITSLGYDHTKLLGSTIEEIAWQKSGIMKPACIAISAPDQPPAGLNVLRERSKKRECKLLIAPKFHEYFGTCPVALGVRGPAQHLNASLAIQLVSAWMNPDYYKNFVATGETAPLINMDDKICSGLRKCSWPGRTQIFRYSSRISYYLDGAHNVESIECCVKWFQQVVPFSAATGNANTKKVLVFNVIGNRDARALLKLLSHCKFDYAIFCPNVIEACAKDLCSDLMYVNNIQSEEYEQSKKYYHQWLELNSGPCKLFSSITETINHMQGILPENSLHILVTGSLHLVGGFLSLLDPDLKLSKAVSGAVTG